ncbi:MAG TPA: hypothetical protein VJ911_05880 [Cryomorphaceae bacterium]|nr:hypothetical protein [Cryomorphaceae bacterium]
MERIYLILIFIATSGLAFGQTFESNLTEHNLFEYQEIKKAPLEMSAGNVIARFLDGLIYRYYWATEGLKSTDLAYRPSKEARSSIETITHIQDLSFVIANAAYGKPNKGTDHYEESKFAEARLLTLQNLSAASQRFSSMPEDSLRSIELIFHSETGEQKLPIWNLMNGPINDAVYHVGQIVSFRRTTGNPIVPGLSMMRGTAPKN